jgi:uncharacterized protein with PhoU and TrkA domain
VGSRGLLRKPSPKANLEARILDRLVQMKDTSEFLINLAYGALLTENKEIAEDILELEDAFDTFHTDFELEVLRMDLPGGEDDKRLALIRLGVAAENLADAAAQMAEIVLRGVDVHPLVLLALEEADERVIREPITTESRLANRTIGNMHLEAVGTRVFAVRRRKRWVYNPPSEFRLRPGDIIYASGYREAAERLEIILRGMPAE